VCSGESMRSCSPAESARIARACVPTWPSVVAAPDGSRFARLRANFAQGSPYPRSRSRDAAFRGDRTTCRPADGHPWRGSSQHGRFRSAYGARNGGGCRRHRPEATPAPRAACHHCGTAPSSTPSCSWSTVCPGVARSTRRFRPWISTKSSASRIMKGAAPVMFGATSFVGVIQ